MLSRPLLQRRRLLRLAPVVAVVLVAVALVATVRRAELAAALPEVLALVLASLFIALRVRGERDARAALTRERDLTATVLDHAGALVLVLDREGTVLRFNRACERASGQSTADVVGRPVWETVVARERRAEVLANLAVILDGDTEQRREREWINAADGSLRHIEWTLRAARGAGLVVCAGLDLTAQRRAEAALEISERRHRRVVEVAHDVLFEIDTERRFTYLAPQWEALTGLPVATSLGLRVDDVFPPEELAGARRGMADLAAGITEQVRVEHRLVRADGAERWIVVRAHALRDGGTLTGFAGAMRDISDDVLLRRRAARDRAFADALVGRLSRQLTICDERGHLQTVDPVTGMLVAGDTAPEEWLVRHRLRAPDGRPLALEEAPLIRALAGEAVSGETVLVDREGADRFIEVNAGPIVDEQGRTLGAVATTFDVTSRHAAEAALQRQAGDLEAVARVAHALADQTDLDELRRTICAAARESAGAAMALLLEPHPDGTSMRCTSADGIDLPGELVIPLGGKPSGTAIAFASGRPFHVGDCLGHPAVDQRLVELTAARTAVWQPVMRDGKTLGVLSLCWLAPEVELAPRTSRMLELLAAEAAIAIERTDLIAQLQASARTDALTGAPNRRTWDQQLTHEVARARRDGRPLCVAMFDLDHFKAYNDTHGHQQGDRLLKATVSAWMAEVRTTDTLARYGGEEFAAAFPVCGADGALELAERLRQRVPFGETCSVGLAEWDGSESADELLARADAALYRAKRQGRNRVVLAARGRGALGEHVDGDATSTQLILRTARRLLGMDVAFLGQIDDDQLVLRDVEGAADAFGIAPGMQVPLADTYCQRVIDGRIDGPVHDARTHPVTRELEMTHVAGIGAYIGAPVRLTDGRVLGTLCGMKRTAAPDLSREDLQLLRGLAEVVARHIEAQVEDPTDPLAIQEAWRRSVGHLLPDG